MKTRARLPAFIVMVAAVLCGWIPAARAQFTFVTNNGAITITAYTGSGHSANIPSATNGYPVRLIGTGAFANNTRLNSITMPNSVTNIGSLAFYSSGLTGIAIPNSVLSIGADAFESCNGLTNISVDPANPGYSSLNGVLFDKAQGTLMQYPVALKSGCYAIPNSVSTVANDAFYGASNISSVTIPAGVGSIGYEAFARCAALSSVYFGGNAPNLDSDAFYETGFGSGITAYYLPGTTGWANFSQALGGSLSAIAIWYLPYPVILNFEASFGVNNGQFGFTISWETNATLIVLACTNLASPVWLPISTNTITATNGTLNFADPQSSSFQSRYYRVEMAPTPFGYSTVNGAITITGYTGASPSVIIPSTINTYPVVAIASAAFYNDSSITGVIIPDGVTNIGSFAFSGCGVTTITIPRSVIEIDQEAFASCDSLTSISVDPSNSVYSSLNGVLLDKGQDTLIEFPSAMIIDNYVIPSCVTTIGAYAFYGASGFASVTIPGSVTSIEDDAFANCYAQENYYLQIYFEGNAPSLGNFVFYQDAYGGVAGNYLPGTTGWKAFKNGADGALASLGFWYQPQPVVLNFEPSFGLKNGQFGFTVSWATNANIVVDACTNLTEPVWLPISTNAITASTGTTNFSDPQWSAYSKRFYRVRSQ